MVFDNIKKVNSLVDDFRKVVSENLNHGFIDALNQSIYYKVYEEFYFSIHTINAICIEERNENLFLIPKENQKAFIDEYNYNVRCVVTDLIHLYNEYNALNDPSLIPNDLLELLTTEYRCLVIKHIVETKDNVFKKAISKYALKQEYQKSVDKITSILEQISDTLNDIKVNFPSEPIVKSDLTAVQTILILIYKIKAGLIKAKTKKDIIDEYKTSPHVKAYYKYFMGNGAHKALPKATDIEAIIPHLNDFPKAGKLANDDWYKITS